MSPPHPSPAYPVVRRFASLMLMAVAGSAMYAAILVLAAAQAGRAQEVGFLPTRVQSATWDLRFCPIMARD